MSSLYRHPDCSAASASCRGTKAGSEISSLLVRQRRWHLFLPFLLLNVFCGGDCNRRAQQNCSEEWGQNESGKTHECILLQREAISTSAFPSQNACAAPIHQAAICVPSCKIIAAPFSAIIAVGVLVLPEVIVGITEASTTRRPSRPKKRSRSSTTAEGVAGEPHLAVPTGWKMVVPMSPAAFARDASSSPTPRQGREIFARTVFLQHRLLHQPPRGADRVRGDAAVLVGREIIRRDHCASSSFAERMRTVPREVGRRLQALTVIAQWWRGSPNLSSDSGCTWNWMLARSRGSVRARKNTELRRRPPGRASGRARNPTSSPHRPPGTTRSKCGDRGGRPFRSPRVQRGRLAVSSGTGRRYGLCPSR